MDKSVTLVFDCGATNVRVMAIDMMGVIHASQAYPNGTFEDPNLEGGRIWNIDDVWDKLSKASQKVMAALEGYSVVAVTVTTFGVDGAFVDEQGALLYPVISWQCGRTTPIMQNIDKYIPLETLYGLSGVYPYDFNTINKLIWFRENKPEIPDNAFAFLFMPSLIIHRLCGAMMTDLTMAGTSMLLDIKERKFSVEILNTIGVRRELFPELTEAGSVVGTINNKAREETGIPVGTPVVSAGHDTQFAVFGSGAGLSQLVLSSGTWEILMARSSDCSTQLEQLRMGLTNELDSIPGIFNIGQNWLAGGAVELVAALFYPGLKGEELYSLMIEEALNVPPGSYGLLFAPSPYETSLDPIREMIVHLGLNHPRGTVFRSVLEGLSYRLRLGLESIEQSGGFKATGVICVGGGSRNSLWNQLRADVTGLPVQLISQKETTVLGASMFAFAGAGHAGSPDMLRESGRQSSGIIEPSENHQNYCELYFKYLDVVRK